MGRIARHEVPWVTEVAAAVSSHDESSRCRRTVTGTLVALARVHTRGPMRTRGAALLHFGARMGTVAFIPTPDRHR